MSEGIDTLVTLLEFVGIACELVAELSIKNVVVVLLVVFNFQIAAPSRNCAVDVGEVEEQLILVNQDLTSLNLSLIVNLNSLEVGTEFLNTSQI